MVPGKYWSEARAAALSLFSGGGGDDPQAEAVPSPSVASAVPPVPTPEARLKAREAEAFALGWTQAKLWNPSKRPDMKGLICFLSENVRLGKVSAEAIEVIHLEAKGREVVLRFRRKPALAKATFSKD